MKISVKKQDLLQSLNHIHSISERKSTIPILLNVKIEADNGKVKLTATNVDLELIEEFEAEVSKGGATTVPTHILYEIVRKLPDGDIVLEEKGSKMDIKAGKSNFSLSTLPVEDFPLMSSSNMPFKFSLSPDDLIKLIDKTKFAISTEETRYFLNGIYLHTTQAEGKNVLRAVATDGHRLARLDVAEPEGSTGMPGVIVPRKVVLELRKLLDDSDNAVTVEISDTKARFSLSNVVLTSKLIDGKFPDYEKVIPSTNDKVLEVDVKTFAQSVDRVSSVSSEKTRAIKIKVSKAGLNISANTPEAGSGMEDIEGTYNSEETLEIGFNSRYLLDVASQIEGKNIKFVMADGASPTVISEQDDNNSIYVLMPMRI